MRGNRRFKARREAKEDFAESMACDVRDAHTTGQSCLIQFREYPAPQTFVPPDWAYKYPTEDSLPSKRPHNVGHKLQNFWWLELGGDKDILHDTEQNRDELLKIALGLCDHIKNYGDHGVQNWNLEWVGFLPGKRERLCASRKRRACRQPVL